MSNQPKRLQESKVPFGITPTLWWNDDFLNIDIGIPFEQCISEMALAGFVGCSIGHKYPADPAVLRAALDLRGLRVSEPWVSTYFTIKDMQGKTLQAFQQQMDFLKQVGATDIVVAEFGQAVNPSPAVDLFANRPILDDRQWDDLCSGLEELGQLANDNGLRLCYHPHMGTGVMISSDVDRLMENTKPDFVHLLLDTGHLAFAGADPLEVTTKYGKRIKHIHLKDVRADIVRLVKEEGLSFYDGIQAGVFTVPGDGAIDFVPIFQALADADFEGWLVIEAEQNPAKANPLQYAKMARAYLREHLGW